MASHYRRLIKRLAPWYDYRRRAALNAAYPYRVMTEVGRYPTEGIDTLSFDIDYWDRADTTDRIEEMIERDLGDGDGLRPSGLNGAVLPISDGVAAHVFATSIFELDDPERELRRVKVRLEAHFIYER